MIQRMMAAALIMIAAPAGGQDISPSLVEAVALSGSRTLTLGFLSASWMPDGARTARDDLAWRMGLGGAPGTVGERDWQFRPVLRWDGNVNGGMANGSLTISGITFGVNDDYRAKGGIVTGAALSGSMTVALAPLTALELDGSATAVTAVSGQARGMVKADLNTSACIRHLAPDGMSSRHGCIDLSQRNNDLGREREIGLEAGAARVFSSFGGVSEASVTIRRETDLDDGYNRSQASLRMISTLPSGIALSGTISAGTGDDEILSMRRRIEGSFGKVIANRQTALFVTWQDSRGGMFLGEERREIMTGIGVMRQVNDKLTVKATAARVRGKHEFFDDTVVGADLGISF